MDRTGEEELEVVELLEEAARPSLLPGAPRPPLAHGADDEVEVVELSPAVGPEIKSASCLRSTKILSPSKMQVARLTTDVAGPATIGTAHKSLNEMVVMCDRSIEQYGNKCYLLQHNRTTHAHQARDTHACEQGR